MSSLPRPLFPAAARDAFLLVVDDMPLLTLPLVLRDWPAEPPNEGSVVPVVVPPRDDVPPVSDPRLVSDREAPPPRALPEPLLRLPPLLP